MPTPNYSNPSIRSPFRSLVLIGVAGLALLAALAGGCSRQNPPATAGSQPRPLKIGLSLQELDNPYFAVMKQAFDEAGHSLGAELFVTDARHDVTKQIADVEDLVQKGINILILNPTDSAGIESAVRTAKQAGIVVVAVDAQANGPIDSFVGSRNHEAGRLAGEELARVLGGKGQVAILDGISVVPILERVRGFKDALAAHPGMVLVGTQNGRQERSAALTATENLLQSHPDLKGIFSVNDGGAVGALAAIQSSRRDVALVSVDGLAEVVDAIVAGGPFKATVAQFPRDQIRLALGLALAKHWGATVPREIPVDVQLLTPANARGFSW
jgi:ribose transport system substrate-binding protein